MKCLVIFSILVLSSLIIISNSTHAEGIPVDRITIKDATGNYITPVLNKEVFFHYYVRNYGNKSQTFDLNISVNNEHSNLPLFHKKMQLILEPDENKPVVWSFTPTTYGNYDARVTNNGITLVNSFSIENHSNPNKLEMNYAEFQDFCKETEGKNLDLMSVDQRLLAILCDFLDLGLSEKQWNWIGPELDWKNFAQKVSEDHAQTMPLFVEKGLKDSLVVDSSVSGRDSYPPPMFVYISFYYDEDGKIKRFGEKYLVNIFGNFTKAKDYRLSPLKQFNKGYTLGEIQCKENLILFAKYDDSPSCVMQDTALKLMKRGWAKNSSNSDESIVIIPIGSASPEHPFPLIPKEITVMLGKNNTVTWLNQDETPSTLNSDHLGWSTGLIEPGESASITFNQTGIYPYHGSPYPWKKGIVIVLQDAKTAPTAEPENEK